jgi:hypothetical protein
MDKNLWKNLVHYDIYFLKFLIWVDLYLQFVSLLVSFEYHIDRDWYFWSNLWVGLIILESKLSDQWLNLNALEIGGQVFIPSYHYLWSYIRIFVIEAFEKSNCIIHRFVFLFCFKFCIFSFWKIIFVLNFFLFMQGR